MSSKDANELFDLLIDKVKTKGYILLFGYTPILISLDCIKSKPIKILSTSGYSPKK